jgi:predicted dehydrogenase
MKSHNHGPVRWGILGTAQIGRKNWKAIFNSGNAVLSAVASRDLRRSRKFVRDCQGWAPFRKMPAALGSYDELLQSDDIDAVYIPLPTGVRKDWVLRAAAAGKHVLCEKPCAGKAADLREMIGACRQGGVRFMDGVMFMHSRRLDKMKRTIADRRRFGDIRRVTSSFSVFLPPGDLESNIRGDPKLEPLGCLGDLGWYCARFTLWAMDWTLPRSVSAWDLSPRNRSASTGHSSTQFSAELQFDGGVSAGFFCSFISASEQWANVSGTRESLRVADFVLPFQGEKISYENYGATYSTKGCDFNMVPRVKKTEVKEHSSSHRSAQESNMIRTFSDWVRHGRSGVNWSEIALKTQLVIDACARSARSGRRCLL